MAVIGDALEIDHIVPLAKGGSSQEENLCLACGNCNQAKGTQTAALDPLSATTMPLFNPRTQHWVDHFVWREDGVIILGKTAVGRATISALNMNQSLIVKARARWVAAGWHPPHS